LLNAFVNLVSRRMDMRMLRFDLPRNPHFAKWALAGRRESATTSEALIALTAVAVSVEAPGSGSAGWAPYDWFSVLQWTRPSHTESIIVPPIMVHTMSVAVLTSTFIDGTTIFMDTQQRRRGRPKKSPDRAKGDYLDIRLEAAEKQAFRDAANLAGLDLSAWVRERLRATARKELEGASLPVAFLVKAAARDRSGDRA
jgi:hypothetical protein